MKHNVTYLDGVHHMVSYNNLCLHTVGREENIREKFLFDTKWHHFGARRRAI
jgi:hypothetical protein